MLYRSNANPSIIAAVAPKSNVGMKIKSADNYYPGEAPAGTIFRFHPKLWTLVFSDKNPKDRDALAHYNAFRKASKHASLPPAG